MGKGKLLGQPGRMLGSNLQWTNIPSREKVGEWGKNAPAE